MTAMAAARTLGVPALATTDLHAAVPSAPLPHHSRETIPGEGPAS